VVEKYLAARIKKIGLWKTGLQEPILAAERGREGRNRGERREGCP